MFRDETIPCFDWNPKKFIFAPELTQEVYPPAIRISGPIVQRIEQMFPKHQIQVRFLVELPNQREIECEYWEVLSLFLALFLLHTHTGSNTINYYTHNQ